MGACASVVKAIRGDGGAKAPPPEQLVEETTAPVETVTEKEASAGEPSEILNEAPKETPEPEATIGIQEPEAAPVSSEEKVTEAKVE